MKHILTILSLLISSYSFSQVVVKVPQQDISGKVNYSDSLSKYVTPSQLATKVDTSHHDITSVFAPLYSVNVNDSTHELHAYVSTDTTFSNASDTTLASSLAVKKFVGNHSTDTTSLSNRINLKQNIISNISDTSKYAKSGTGVSPYIQKVVAANVLGNSNIKDSAGIWMTPDTIKGISSGYGINLKQVWTTSSSSPTLIYGNAIGSAGGVLVDLQWNGISKFKILTGGNATFTNNITGLGFTGQKITSSGGSATAINSFLSQLSYNQISAGFAFGFKNMDGFIDTIGNASYNAFYFGGTIYQGLASTATGITRGLYINPLLTNPHDFRSIEFDNDIGKGIYQRGAAPNSFVGKTLFSTDSTKTASAQVEIRPSSTGVGGGGLKVDPGTVVIPEAGLIENDSINNHLLWTNRTGARLQLDKQSIDTVTNSTALINYSGVPNLVYLTDTLQAGLFYYSTITNTANNGTVFTATGKGSGYWVRVYDKSKGISVDWFGSRDEVAIKLAIAFAGQNGIINFTPNKLYTQRTRILPQVNQTFQGNNATLQRGNDSIVVTTSVANVTDTYIVVNAVPSFWNTSGGYIHLFTDTTDFSSSNTVSISSISGDTIRLASAVGALSAPDATHPQITSWAIGTKVHFVYTQIEDNGNRINFSIYNLTFDGNRANNNANHSWRINTTIALKGTEGQATIDHCRFYNIPNENIMGHGFKITNNYANNLNGSFVHLSALYGQTPPQTPTIISGNITDSTNRVQQIVTNHSEGAITFSNTSGYTTIQGNRFYYGNDAVFGVIQSGNGSNGGVRDLLIENNYAEGFNKIFYNVSMSDPTGVAHKQGHIFVTGNTFNNCGINDWTSFQTNIDKSDTIMIGNNLLVGGTTWTIPVQNSDAQQRFILNNSTSTPQGGSINVSGAIKGNIFDMGTTTTPAPASGHAVVWFDGTNVKVTKNVGGATTTATLF
jgi:hypothetical protein